MQIDGQDVLRPSPASGEWLLVNGLGGSGSGATDDRVARWSHGLLAARDAQGGATMLLLDVDVRLQSAPAARVPIVASPVDPTRTPGVPSWPRWRLTSGPTVIERSAMPVHLHHAVVLAWRLIEGPPVRVTATPLVTARPLDGPGADPARLRGTSQAIPGRARIETVPGAPHLTLWHNGQFLPARVWARALPRPDGSEDALIPGHIDALIDPERPLLVVASAEDDLFRALAAEERLGVPPARTLAACVAALEQLERERAARWRRTLAQGADFTARQAAAAHGGPADPTARRPEPLVAEGDALVTPLAFTLRDGLVRRGLRLTLASTLPRAGEHGIDALRAVPALVSLRAFDLAREVLRGYVEYVNEGFTPSTFEPADGTPVYDDPAVSLWLVHAADVYVRRSADGEFLEQTLFPALEGVLQSYRAGAPGGVRVNAEGLLCADAHGTCPSPLNALWGHALLAMAQLARLAGRRENGAFYLAWARELQRCFNEVLWDEPSGCLYASVGPEGPVSGLSPGQLLAVALPPPLLPPDRARRLVETVHDALATPWGLRDAPGAMRVDPTWIGPFARGWLRVNDRSTAAQETVRGWYTAITGVSAPGAIPERYALVEGGAVPAPGADPVSVVAAAELLRGWIEDVDLGAVPVPAAHAAE